jgi:hypothetical protein
MPVFTVEETYIGIAGDAVLDDLVIVAVASDDEGKNEGG